MTTRPSAGAERALEDVLAAAESPEPLIDARAVSAWPAGALDRLVGLGLLADAGPAASFACDSCGFDHVEEVRWVTDPDLPARAFVACPHVGPVRIDPEALRRWAVRLPALAQLTAEALGAAGIVAEQIPGRVWKLGVVRAGGRSWPAHLAVGLEHPDAAGVAASAPELRAANALVLVPSVVPPPAVWPAGTRPSILPLTDLLSLGPTGLAADRGVLESAIAPASPAARPKTAAGTFPTPPGTTWEDVEVVVEDLRLVVRVGNVARAFGFAEAGFEDRRKGNVPDEVWELLRLLARLGGTLGTGDRLTTKTAELKQRVSVLRGRLRALLGLDADPFHPAGRGRAYRARFAVRSADGPKFPTPEGAGWDDVTLAEQTDGRIEVTVAAPAAGVTFVRGWEATTAAGERGRRYALAEMGLVGPDGRPAPAGEALVAVLRAGGRLALPASDPGLLALGRALAAFFNLPDPPFEFDQRRGEWVAKFEAASLAPPSDR